MHAAQPTKRLVVVLGMHRSGTSLLTRALAVLGVSLGDRLMPAAEENPKGFWEDLDINALNIAILEALGHSWHSLAPTLPGEVAEPLLADFKRRALAILRDRLSDTDCFGLKDPRMSRLLPFWQDVFSELKIKVSYVVVCRNPVSVARSLAKRNGFDQEKSYHLWLGHMIEILARTQNCHRVVVDYDLFLADPAGQLQRIAQGLGLEFLPGCTEVSEFTTSFLESSLRHHHYRLQDFLSDQALPPQVTTLYQLLLKLASYVPDWGDGEIAAVVDHIRNHYEESYPTLRYLQFCEQKAVNLTRQVAEQNHQITGLNYQVIDLTRSLAASEAAITVLRSEVAQLTSQLTNIYTSRFWKIGRLFGRMLLPLKRYFLPAAPSRTDPASDSE